MGIRDLLGQKFGEWTVIAPTNARVKSSGGMIWLCRCSCSVEREVSAGNLLNRLSTNCGCVRSPRLKSGTRFGRWTVVGPSSSRDAAGCVCYVCRCDCGTERPVSSQSLRVGVSQSCGCILDDLRGSPQWGKWSVSHGMAKKHPLYGVWEKMKARCYIPTTQAYRYYGGRGITICSKWRRDFGAFFKWALANGYEKGLTIERKDNNGNYGPRNCCWATHKEQCRNRRSNRIVIYKGRPRVLAELCETLGVGYGAVYTRLKSGMSAEDAVARTSF